MKEALRLYPPLWLLERTVDRPTRLAGYPLRPGQRVAVSPYVLQRDPRHYDRPAAFRPERPATPLPKYAFMPFGGGPRTCLGAHFAMVAMVTATATATSSPATGSPAPRAPRPCSARAPSCSPAASPSTSRPAPPVRHPQGVSG